MSRNERAKTPHTLNPFLLTMLQEAAHARAFLKDAGKKTAVIALMPVTGGAGTIFGDPDPTKLGGATAIIKALKDYDDLVDEVKKKKKEHPKLCTP